MSEHKGNIEANKNELLTIFIAEEDKKGTDLLSMSDFFIVFINRLKTEMDTDTTWEAYLDIDVFAGEIASAIKAGFDISKMGLLVADYSHFSQEIIDGLKDGTYHVGQSKEVAGNLRPAILNDKERLVKFFTLRKASDPSIILSDVATLSIQASLQRISSQIADIDRDVRNVIDFVRRETLSNKFLYARDKIMMAANADGKECIEFLKEADTYLMEGLANLYTDVNAQITALEKQKGPFASVKNIDKILSYINEDMQMIPRYVGLRVYLLNYRNMPEDAKRILGEYRYQLQTLAERKIGKSKSSAFELIHKCYPYNSENMDFWLNVPTQMISAIDSYEKMIEQKYEDIYYIDAESEDE